MVDVQSGKRNTYARFHLLIDDTDEVTIRHILLDFLDRCDTRHVFLEMKRQVSS